MNKEKDYINYFSDKEKPKMKQFASLRTSFFSPIVKFLIALKLKPDHISYIGLSLLLPFSLLFISYPIIAAILIWAYVLIDGIDGSLARELNISNNGGAFTDIVCDQIGLIIMVFNLIYHDFIHASVGYIYGILYIVMIAFSVVQNYLNIEMQTIIRTKYVTYAMYSIWAVFQFESIEILNLELNIQEYFSYPIILFSIIMIITNIISYNRLKSKLSEI